MNLAMALCVAALIGCVGPASRSNARPHTRPAASARSSAPANATAGGPPAVPRRPGRTELAAGLVVERVPLRGAGLRTDAGATAPDDSLLTLLRIDPQRWQLRLLTAAAHGGARTAPEWARAFQLAAVINAALYLPDQRSIGLMIDGDTVNNPRDNRRLAGFLAFAPRREGLPPVRIYGRDCQGFALDDVRGAYATVIQNYRMLDCQRAPIEWKDEKRYGIAGIALDDDGWVVFLHCAAPLRVNDLNARLAQPDLDLTAAVFVEGGRQANLFAEAAGGLVEEVGTEARSGALEGLGRAFWPIPNVVGVAARTAGPGRTAPKRG